MIFCVWINKVTLNATHFSQSLNGRILKSKRTLKFNNRVSMT